MPGNVTFKWTSVYEIHSSAAEYLYYVANTLTSLHPSNVPRLLRLPDNIRILALDSRVAL